MRQARHDVGKEGEGKIMDGNSKAKQDGDWLGCSLQTSFLGRSGACL